MLRAARSVFLACAVASILVCAPSRAPADNARARYLAVAATDIRNVESEWWNPQAGWYGQIPYSHKSDAHNIATLWDAYGLFEAIDLLAIAQPTAPHLADVERFGRGAEQYWDPDAGGYWYSLDAPQGADLFFDDNGWIGLAFFDAYAATGDRRFLRDAIRAYTFIKTKGWDPDGGGIWWNTDHDRKTIEPLAAEVLLASQLYRVTHARTYLTEARRLTSWADRHSWNRARGLYQRSPTSNTVMDYAQGMMIGADAILCKTRHRSADCRRAEQLADASLEAFPRSYHWTPEADAIYLRGLLQLAAVDHMSRWYAEADHWGRRALANVRDGEGLPTEDWDGGPSAYRLLRPGGTLMLFTSLGSWPTLK
jgi:hypothetical protein